MRELNFVFLIRENGCWGQLFSHVDHLNEHPEETKDIVVVAIGTALLSYLKSTRLDAFKSTVSRLASENVKFYLCINTLTRYGISEDMLLPEVAIAREGGLLEVARLESMGYHSITLG